MLSCRCVRWRSSRHLQMMWCPFAFHQRLCSKRVCGVAALASLFIHLRRHSRSGPHHCRPSASRSPLPVGWIGPCTSGGNECRSSSLSEPSSMSSSRSVSASDYEGVACCPCRRSDARVGSTGGGRCLRGVGAGLLCGRGDSLPCKPRSRSICRLRSMFLRLCFSYSLSGLDGPGRPPRSSPCCLSNESSAFSSISSCVRLLDWLGCTGAALLMIREQRVGQGGARVNLEKSHDVSFRIFNQK